MKVLQINAVYNQGSTGVIVRDIESLCFKNGIECYVASPDPNVRDAVHGYLIGNFFDHKLHALLSRIVGKQAYFSRIPTWCLFRYIKKIRPDIVHIHNVHSNYIHFNCLLAFLAKNRIKTIITLHDCWIYTGGCFHYSSVGCNRWMYGCGNCPKKRNNLISRLGDKSKDILKDRDKYINAIPEVVINGVSEWITDECRKSVLNKNRILAIPNGVDLEIFKPTPIPSTAYLLKDLQSKIGGKRVILAPASKWLLPINHEVFMYFVEHMKNNEVMVLYGICSNSLSLPSNVIPFGYIRSREEMAALYTMADVLVNCTREDSLSLLNVECQACGTPVVTFNATAPRETVDNVNSFSVKVGDSEALYEKTEYVLNNTIDTTNDACRNFVLNYFEKNKNYQKYIDLYYSI